jgi:hypothetical protein
MPMRRVRWVGALRQPSSEGCGTWVFTCVLSLLFLVINVALVRTIYSNLAMPLWPEVLRRPRIEQATHIVLPAALLFVQWWLVELFADWFKKSDE